MAYYTRPMMASDIYDVAQLSAEAYVREDTVMQKAYPGSRAHPGLWLNIWLRITKQHFRHRGRHIWLAVQRKPDGTQEVVGVASWMRRGPESSPEARVWRQRNSSVWAAVERCVLDAEERYALLTRAEAAVTDYPALAMFEAASTSVQSKWRAHYSDTWHLSNLAVSPRHQRKGLAAKLLAWGLERSDEEGVPITLLASPDGLPVYQKHGFRVVDRAVVEGSGHVFDPFLIYEPPRLRPDIPTLAQVEEKVAKN